MKEKQQRWSQIVTADEVLAYARKKVDQARFFLGKLQTESRREVRHEPEAFECYFSAFLAMGRAVTRSLWERNEDRLTAWLDGFEKADRELYILMWKTRDEDLHRGGAKTTQDWRALQPREVSEDHRRSMRWFGPPGCPPPVTLVPEYSFAAGDEKVVPACVRFLELLKLLVDEFEKDPWPPAGVP